MERKTMAGRAVAMRLPLLALGMLSLLTAIWGGLVRLPIQLPLPPDNANWVLLHGPLMVCGFLGTVIGLERAVGLPGRWPYLAPLLTGAGALLLVSGVPGAHGPVLLTAGSAVFVIVASRVLALRLELFTVTMGLGGVAWLVGNILWLCAWPVGRVVPWWIGFLCLTIVGERLDLSRFQKQVRVARPLFHLALAVFLAGIVLSAFVQTAGERTMGAGMLALAAWLARFDIARRTVRQAGLPRFMAVCLLSGYVWLVVAGVMFLLAVPLRYGGSYDAALHAFFLGFVFAMIFGHAPVIFPSILARPVAFHPRFYLHLGMLHVSLALRVVGDLGGWLPLRVWGGVFGAVTLVLFLGSTVAAILFPSGQGKPGSS